MTAEDLLQPFIAERAIDLTAFLGTWPWRLQASADVAALGALADRLGLSALCVSHIGSVFGFDTRSGNEVLLQSVQTDTRLLPFAVLNPTRPDADSELSWALAAGARGVRLTPGYHGYRLSDPAVTDFLDGIGTLPLHVCARLDDERLRHPQFRADDVPVAELAEFIRANPGRRLVLSGLRSTEWDAVEAHLNSTDDYSGVLLDLWFVNGPAQIIRGICERDQAIRYAFGSAAPVQTAEATALQLAVAEITPGQRRLLCRANAERFLHP